MRAAHPLLSFSCSSVGCTGRRAQGNLLETWPQTTPPKSLKTVSDTNRKKAVPLLAPPVWLAAP